MPRRRPLAALGVAAVAITAAVAAGSPAIAVAPTPRVVATIAGMLSTSFAIALSPSGSTAYVANTSDRLAIVDTATNAVTGSESLLSSGPRRDVAVAVDGSQVYASGANGLDVLDPDGTLALTVGASPGQLGAIAAAPGGASVVGVADSGGPVLYRFNLSVPVPNHSPIAIPGPSPLALDDVAIDPGSGKVYVTGVTAASQAVLYTFDDVFGTNPQQILLPGSASAGALALSPDGSRAAVMDPVSRLLHIVDTATGAVAAPVSTTTNGIGLAFSPDGSTVYAASDNGIDLVDAASRTLAATLSLPGTTVPALALSPSGNRIWAVDGSSPGTPLLLLAASSVVAGSGSATAGAAFSEAFGASGFDLPVSYSVAPALPAGMSLDAATGVVSGTPAGAQATTPYTVTAASGDGNSATTTWSLRVSAAVATPPGPGTPAPSAPAPPARLAASGGEVPWLAALAGGMLLIAGVAGIGLRRRAAR